MHLESVGSCYHSDLATLDKWDRDLNEVKSCKHHDAA
jgi:hypothetical protein